MKLQPFMNGAPRPATPSISKLRVSGHLAARRSPRRGFPLLGLASVAAAGLAVSMACSSSQTDLTVLIGHAHVPNGDWDYGNGDKSDAYAKVMVGSAHKQTDVILDNNHPTFNVRLHLGA